MDPTEFPAITTNTVTVRKKGDRQHLLREKEVCANAGVQMSLPADPRWLDKISPIRKVRKELDVCLFITRRHAEPLS